MNTWIRRSTCLGVLTAGLVASAATGASAATDPSAGPDPISAVLDVTADVSPAVVGQGGNGGQGGDGNKVAGADNAVGNGGRGGTTDASTLAKVPETLGNVAPATASGAVPLVEEPTEPGRESWLVALGYR